MSGPTDYKEKGPKIIIGPTPSYIKQLSWDAGRSLPADLDIDFGHG